MSWRNAVYQESVTFDELSEGMSNRVPSSAEIKIRHQNTMLEHQNVVSFENSSTREFLNNLDLSL